MPTSRLCLIAAAAALVACPQAQMTPGELDDGAAGVDRGDPRVVADTGDLYPGKAPSGAVAEAEAKTKDPPPEPTVSRGTGRPDETNGACRLYAPELPDPACCAATFGFDVAAAQQACGLTHYLGESFHGTCGFYFLREAGSPPQWLRLSAIRGDTPKQAAEEHVAVMQRSGKDPSIVVEPLADVPGAIQVRHKEYRWTFLPGWKKVRMLSSKESSCGDAGVAALARALIAAPETPSAVSRDGLLPSATPGAPPTTPATPAAP